MPDPDDAYLAREARARKQIDEQHIATYEDRIVYATVGPDDAIYAISRAGAPNGKILKLAAPYGKLAQAKTIVPESAVAILSGGAESHDAGRFRA